MSFDKAALLATADAFLTARENNRDCKMELETLTILLNRAQETLADHQALRWIGMLQDRKQTASPRFLRDILDLLKHANWQNKPSKVGK